MTVHVINKCDVGKTKAIYFALEIIATQTI